VRSTSGMRSRWETRRIFFDASDVRLCAFDFAGSGIPALLLHGLAGRAVEWRRTAAWLKRYCRVVALEQRGHGASGKATDDFSRDAYVRDAISVAGSLGPPVVLIGQSMGGLNAFLVAARRPGSHACIGGSGGDACAEPRDSRVDPEVAGFMAASVPHACRWNGVLDQTGCHGETWIEVLEERADGYWPQFEVDAMVRSVADQDVADYWSEWASIDVPTLVVRGSRSFLPDEQFAQMTASRPSARYIEVADAGHDVHVEQPEGWRDAVEPFIRETLN
jgi:pimeloyl-ACP methyl ester carboxylesterase